MKRGGAKVRTILENLVSEHHATARVATSCGAGQSPLALLQTWLAKISRYESLGKSIAAELLDQNSYRLHLLGTAG